MLGGLSDWRTCVAADALTAGCVNTAVTVGVGAGTVATVGLGIGMGVGAGSALAAGAAVGGAASAVAGAGYAGYWVGSQIGHSSWWESHVIDGIGHTFDLF